MKFEILSTKTIYEGKVFDLRQDQVRMPNGNQARFDIIDHPPAVTVLPVDEENHIWFIRQYRHATGGEILELPAGVVDEGEPPEICARREIREEIGMSAGSLRRLGGFYLAPGYSTEYMHIFLAQNLTPDPLPGDIDEFLHVEKIPLAEIDPYIQSGRIQDAKTIAALMLARPHFAQLS